MWRLQQLPVSGGSSVLLRKARFGHRHAFEGLGAHNSPMVWRLVERLLSEGDMCRRGCRRNNMSRVPL